MLQYPKSFFKREYFGSSIVCWLLLLAVLGNLGNWALIYFGITQRDMPIILHYNVYFGVDAMGYRKDAFILPIIGLVILAANFILGFYFYEKKERIATYLLLIAAFMIQLSLLVASLSIVMINY